MVRQFAVWVAMVVVTLGMASSASAGAVDGPQRKTTSVAAFSTDVYRVEFVGEAPAFIALAGDGDTDLDLLVYDANGNLVASDEDGTDRCVVFWVPKWTGTFTIKVRNYGPIFNRYTIATN